MPDIKMLSGVFKMQPSAESNIPPTEASTDDGYQRRREQVRRAQRTHRDRKATYVKALETEVADLRARSAAYEAGVAAAQNTIRQLKDLLISNGIAIPPELQVQELEGPMARVELVGRFGRGQRIEAQMPEFDASAPYPYERRHADTSSGQSSHDSGFPSSTPSVVNIPAMEQSAVQDENTESHYDGHPHGLDTTQVGVNFVLALEQPCLTHHGILSPELLMEGCVGGGHESMLSSPIMSRAPSFSFNPFSFGRPPGDSWNVPIIELERLLSLSQQLDLDESEMTPVQAWQLIRGHPNFERLLPGQLDGLREMFLPLVKCYGYDMMTQSD